MKKVMLAILTVSFLSVLSTNVCALSFDVDAGNSAIVLSNVNEGDWWLGGSDITASLSTPYANPYSLSDGASFSFEFASITLDGFGLGAIGSANATATLAFVTGDSPYVAGGEARYITLLGGIIDAGGLHWNTQPGTITLDDGNYFDVFFADISGVSFNEGTYSIMANVTGHGNDVAPAPVPEPASMLLLGTGMVGLAGASRKRIFKKS